jgi:hypothetical protein
LPASLGKRSGSDACIDDAVRPFPYVDIRGLFQGRVFVSSPDGLFPSRKSCRCVAGIALQTAFLDD